MTIASTRQRFSIWMRNTLLSGLVVLTPIALTLYVVDLLLSATDKLLCVLPAAMQPPQDWRFPGSGLIVALLVTLLAGLLARNLVARMIGRFGVSLIERIPVIAGLYNLFRQISQTFLGSGAKGFQRVVLVEWPRRDAWTLAFVTGEVQKPMADALADDESAREVWLNLFVPTTPNPTSGFYFTVPERDTRTTSLSVEAAFKVIISGGALTP